LQRLRAHEPGGASLRGLSDASLSAIEPLKEAEVFTLSARGAYGLTALVELGSKHPGGVVQIREIADAHDIPQHYLEQILVILKKAGLVESIRGAQGGYVLARPPARIGVLEILECLEGPLEIVPTSRRKGALDFYWTDLDNRIRELLTLTLEELIAKTNAASGHFIYMI
jgi:Rrf2 family cysteine metabolism transcriptional repressor